ncbi:pickpocket protein 19-like [Anastrepha ludens]|uniref:pickpocket protein 19-like n=1 Tax=Anastrepha ludens TaxID=28586 RepID=UPI0023AED182|nr:pickpocket protein 19-like [Anastrepha ludens]
MRKTFNISNIQPINDISRPTKKGKVVRFKRKNCLENCLEELGEYGKETNVHGLKRMLTCNAGRWERALWTLGFIFALSLLIYFTKFLAHRFKHSEFKTTIYSTHYPIYKVPFPEVTICNKNRLNWERLEQVKEKFLWPAHHNSSYEQLFVEIIAMYDNLRFGYFYRFSNLKTKPIYELNYINFTEVVRHMTWRCEELLTDCVWRDRPMNCCDIFIRRRSTNGLCMAFNSVESVVGSLKQKMDSKWPWRVTESGPHKGLQVRVLLNEKKHSPFTKVPKGILLMTVQPQVWSYTAIDIPRNVFARIYIDAYMSFFDSDTRRLSSKKRRCVFQDEVDSADFKTLSNHVYMLENCRAECQQEYLLHYCNCTVDLFFPAGSYRICKLVDLPCLGHHNHLLRYFEETAKDTFTTNNPGLACNCFFNCRSLRYFVKGRTRALQAHEQWTSNDTVLLDMNFMKDYIFLYKTNLVYTWVDLLFNFGNITALFLGCSLISLVELIYFFLVKVPQRRLRKHKSIVRSKGAILLHTRPPLSSYRK